MPTNTSLSNTKGIASPTASSSAGGVPGPTSPAENTKACDEKMDSSKISSSGTLKPPAPGGRRMRSASNIALVEIPRAPTANINERPIQRAIRETASIEPEPVAIPKPAAAMEAVGKTDKPAEPVASEGPAEEKELAPAENLHEPAVEKIEQRPVEYAVRESISRPLVAVEEEEENVFNSVSAQENVQDAQDAQDAQDVEQPAQPVLQEGGPDVIAKPRSVLEINAAVDVVPVTAVLITVDEPIEATAEESDKFDQDMDVDKSDAEAKPPVIDIIVDEHIYIVSDLAEKTLASAKSIKEPLADEPVDVEMTESQGDGDDAARVVASDPAPSTAETTEQPTEQSEETPEDSDAQGNDNTNSNEAARKVSGAEAETAAAAAESAEDIGMDKPRVQIYGSTVSGNRTYKKQARDLFAMLEANEIDFEFICLAVDEQAKKYVRRKALGNMTIPQVYVDGDFKGFFEDAFKANEGDELYEWLGLDEEPFEY